MAKWLEYFKVDVRTQTHPFEILRIVEHSDSASYSAESPFAHDYLDQQGWGKQFPSGKFYLVVNERLISNGCDGATTNGRCLFRFKASDLKPGRNHVRVDILVDNPLGPGGWIRAVGPDTNLILDGSPR